ncbi:MAG: NAD(P)-dependent oxidoreductase [Methylotenera sp.]|nr:NAD(P)-dependent oxidoreductase [Methylotenera sp.]
MKVAITGATGFIGSHLLEHHLSLGDEVNVLTRRDVPHADNVNIFFGDLSLQEPHLHPNFIKDVEVLYHCAAELNDKLQMENVNVLGTKKLIDLARFNIKRWVNLSSVGAYGPFREGIVDESFPELPLNEYETTKTISDNLVRQASNAGAFEYVVLRPSNVYGIGMSNTSLYEIILMIQRNCFFYIGQPTTILNYVHIHDVVNALYICGVSEKAKNSTFIISDSCSIREFTNIIKKSLNNFRPTYSIPEMPVRMLVKLLSGLPRFPLTLARVNALTSKVVYSSESINKVLGCELKVTSQAGLTELVENWYKIK